MPDWSDWEQLPTPTSAVSHGGLTAAFGAAGELAALSLNGVAVPFALPAHPLGEFLYQTYSQDDVNAFMDAYLTVNFREQGWVQLDDGKWNMSSAVPTPVSARYAPTAQAAYMRRPTGDLRAGDAATALELAVVASLPDRLGRDVGGPSTVVVKWQLLASAEARAAVDANVTLLVLDKAPTRLAESMWFALRPALAGSGSDARAPPDVSLRSPPPPSIRHAGPPPPRAREQRSAAPAACSWSLEKLGSRVDLANVLRNGSSTLHGATGPLTAGCAAGGPGATDGEGLARVVVDSMDAAVLRVLYKGQNLTAYPLPLADGGALPEVRGVAYSLYNNLWGTNYIMWYPFAPEDRHLQYRWRVRLEA